MIANGLPVTPTASIGALADGFAEIMLSSDPFDASFMAISGYDDAVPDLSPEYRQARRGRLVDIVVRCGQREADPGEAGSRVLLETVRDKAARALAVADSRVGPAFDVRDFHSAILDHGFPPLAVLGQVVAEWVACTAAA
jgi:hypothetical protein